VRSWGWLSLLGRLIAMGAFVEVPQTPTISLSPGMLIDRSVTVRPGVYRLPAASDLETPGLTIFGQTLTIDFNGATLAGGPETADPDSFAGVGIFIDGGSNVTVKNAVIRGYKVGILARQSSGLHLTGHDLSCNWKQRLYSGIEKESLVDWMSDHQNDPVKQTDTFAKLVTGIPLKEVSHDRLDYISGRGIENGVARDRFALVAEGTATLPLGEHTLTLISDDGPRGWMDGEEIIDAWTPDESRVDHAVIRGGDRKFKVEYYEVGGFAELRYDIQRR
jgi:hypothetical protein